MGGIEGIGGTDGAALGAEARAGAAGARVGEGGAAAGGGVFTPGMFIPGMFIPGMFIPGMFIPGLDDIDGGVGPDEGGGNAGEPPTVGAGLLGPMSIPGMLIAMFCIAAMRFVSESTRNWAEVTTRSPSATPAATG